MDEHDKRAREVLGYSPHYVVEDAAAVNEIARWAATLRETARAAVAAERERYALHLRARAAEERLKPWVGSEDESRREYAADALVAEADAIALTPAEAEQRVSEEEQERTAETVRMLRCIEQMYMPDSPGGMALAHAISVLRSEADALEQDP